MNPLTVKVRLLAKSGHCINFDERCPVPESYLIPNLQGGSTYYKRLFAILNCITNPLEVQLVVYREIRAYESSR